MSIVGQIEKHTQARIVALLRDRLQYDYLGNWIDRPDNRNIEAALVRSWLLKQGVSELLVSRALHELEKVAGDSSKSLYDRNAEVYRLLRYGVHVKPDVGEKQPRQSPREMASGESHYFMGRRYRLRVHEQDGPQRVAIRGLRMLDLFVRPGATTEQREDVLLRWYREQLKARIPALLEKWQPVMGVRVRDWGIKRMKTKWGTCSIDAGRIWVNLELAKKPLLCLEYIVVHEMVHLLERSHGEQFARLMDQFLPDWSSRRVELQRSVLGAENWDY